MLDHFDSLSEKYFASLGASALEGVCVDEEIFDADTPTNPGLERNYLNSKDLVQVYGRPKAYLGRVGQRDSSVCLGGGDLEATIVMPQLHSENDRFQALIGLLDRILGDCADDSISITARYEAAELISRMPSGCALPEADFGDGEIILEWHRGPYSAIVSIEGDGIFGYALKENGKYVPGSDSETVREKILPQDLVEYLKKIDHDD